MAKKGRIRIRAMPVFCIGVCLNHTESLPDAVVYDAPVLRYPANQKFHGAIEALPYTNQLFGS